MGETLTREHVVSWLAAVEASPWSTVGAPQADLRTALEMVLASLDLAEQLSTARRELGEVRAAAKALVDAADACEREAENHPSSRSSAPLVRYVAAMSKLRETLNGTCSVCGADIILPQVVSAIARAAAAEERRSILHETGSTVTRACAALVRLSAPDDVDDAYVPRAAVVDIALGLQRDMKAIRSRSAAGGQGGGE